MAGACEVYLRCSVHRQAKRAGRIVRAGAEPVKAVAGRPGRVGLRRAAVLRALRADPFSGRYLDCGGEFVVMYAREAYHPREEDRADADRKRGGRGSARASLAYNNPNAWVMLEGQRRGNMTGNDASCSGSPELDSSESPFLDVHLPESTDFNRTGDSDTPVKVFVDIRFIPRRAFEAASSDASSSDASPAANRAPPSAAGYFGVALVTAPKSEDPVEGGMIPILERYGARPTNLVPPSSLLSDLNSRASASLRTPPRAGHPFRPFPTLISRHS